MKLEQITIIGVGLIGGSIGLAVKKNGLARKVIGVTAHRQTLKKALKRKAIDSGTLDMKKSVVGSDMVIVAAPVDKILSALKKIKANLKEGSIVIDVGSVKKGIVQEAERIIGEKHYFVGIHPMAGSEQRGVDKADRDLFRGTPCVLTKTPRTNRKALKIVEKFWKTIGSKTYVVSPCEHDDRISNVSHLPHVIASVLSLVLKPSSMDFASTGFKDTTRIASGDPDLWASILMMNRANVGADIAAYTRQLKRIKGIIVSGKKKKLKTILRQSKKRRDIFCDKE